MTSSSTPSITFTGERFIPEETDSEISLEHVHRYLMAAAACGDAVVLDAACGSGYGSALLARSAQQVFGVDVDPEAVAYAEASFGGENIEFRTASVLDLPFEAATFDVIVSFETLEHLGEQEQMLAEFRRVLKPGGILIISTPDKPIYNASLAEPNRFHVRELTRAEFETLLRDRFRTVEFYGQRVAFGSVTLPQEGQTADLRAYRRPQQGRFSEAGAFDASMYLVAVCTDGPSAPKLPAGLYEGGIPQNAMSALLGGIAERDAQIRTLGADLQRGEEASRRLKKDVRELNDDIDTLADQKFQLRDALTRTQDHAQDLEQRWRRSQDLGGAALRAMAQGTMDRWAHRYNLRLALNDLFVAARRCRLHPKRTLRLLKEIRLVRSSGLIDHNYYAPQKAETVVPGFEDARNYVLAGRRLDPNRLFSGASYLALNPDVEASPLSPLAHFILFGVREGRPFMSPEQWADSRPPEAAAPLERAWPALQAGDPSKLAHFELRPDDIVPVVGRAGRAFMERHALLTDAPDFAGAARALAELEVSPAVTPGDGPAPRVSIVIPVFGQLAYTLNCLHALLSHESRYSFEILIGDDASPDQTQAILSGLPHLRYVRHPQNRGFVDNCNATAALARGEYVVMLNNDTRVAPGWLDELIGSFDLFPKAGLVGSKLFYDDGTLQEAGGLFWKDGSAWNYGRDDDPNRPQYCYARQVDYVSGASIALPTALWKELGGFDPLFRPAYCEDADIAFRIRQRGLETWMQPLSRVIHYEGRTSGTDLTQGVKAHQVANMKTLFERWKGVLADHRPNGERPLLEKDRSVTKRVLVIDATTPTPTEDAGSVLAVTDMQLYQQMGYKVFFIPLHNFLYQREATDGLHRIGVECAYGPYERTLLDFLREHGPTLDLVHIFRPTVAEEALELVRRYAVRAPVVYDNVDMHSVRMERQAEQENDPQLLQAAAEMRDLELRLSDLVDCTIVHQEPEASILRAEVPGAEVIVAPFVTPVMGTKVGFHARRDVMFLGGYRHVPNIDAAMFLAHDIWPRVRAKLPDARLVIVGAQPTQEVLDLAADDIVVTGKIEDLRPVFDATRVFAACLRFGAGVKGKVCTSMSYGVPVVATSIAAEGMFLQDGENVRIADDAEAFAERIVEIYADAAEWERLSANSIELVSKTNSFETGYAVLAEAVKRARQRFAAHAGLVSDRISTAG